jgi:hypothetical protein
VRSVFGTIQKQLPQFTYVEGALGSDPDQRNYIVSNEKVERTGVCYPLRLLDPRELWRIDPVATCRYIAASRSGRGGVAWTSSFLLSCCAAKIIARSARAVIVKSGLTPTAEGTAAPSHT